jgi:hypothetical protein
MILLTITASWILVLSIVAGLCMSARRGDAEFLGEPASPAPSGPARLQGWDQAGELRISACATPHAGAPAGREVRTGSRSPLAGVGGAAG